MVGEVAYQVSEGKERVLPNPGQEGLFSGEWVRAGTLAAQLLTPWCTSPSRLEEAKEVLELCPSATEPLDPSLETVRCLDESEEGKELTLRILASLLDASDLAECGSRNNLHPTWVTAFIRNSVFVLGGLAWEARLLALTHLLLRQALSHSDEETFELLWEFGRVLEFDRPRLHSFPFSKGHGGIVLILNGLAATAWVSASLGLGEKLLKLCRGCQRFFVVSDREGVPATQFKRVAWCRSCETGKKRLAEQVKFTLWKRRDNHLKNGRHEKVEEVNRLLAQVDPFLVRNNDLPLEDLKKLAREQFGIRSYGGRG